MTRALDADVGALLARVAHTAILPRYRHLAAGEITNKAVDDVVTVADTDAEALLSEALARLLPEAAIVGEEAAAAEGRAPGTAAAVAPPNRDGGATAGAVAVQSDGGGPRCTARRHAAYLPP